MDRILILLATCCFAVNFLAVLVRLRRGGPHVTKGGLVLTGAGFVLQNWVLLARGQTHGRCPITNATEILLFLAWAVVLWYFILGPTYRLSLLGIFTSALVAFLQGVALLPGIYSTETGAARVAPDPWIQLHGSLSLLAYGAFAAAALAGTMYLLQDQFLKERRLTPVFFHLPPINHLFQAMMLVLVLGCVLLVAGLLAGYATAMRPPIAKHVVSYVVLGLYAAVVVARWCGVGHRRVAIGAVAAFIAVAASLGFVS